MKSPQHQDNGFKKYVPSSITGNHTYPLLEEAAEGSAFHGNGYLNNGHRRKLFVDPYSKKGDYATVEDIQTLGLQPSDINLISKCDEQDGLKLFHFRENYASLKVEEPNILDFSQPLKKSWADMDEEKQRNAEELKRRISAIRGWVLAGRTVISKSFSEATIVHLTPSELSVYERKGYIFSEFLEGTTVRLFWYGNNWLHSTNRRIDCVNSRIPGVEIGFMQMFKEACPEFNYELLNKNMIYIFQIVHVHNQLMNQDVLERPKLYHLATIFGATTPYPMKIVDAHGDSPDNSGYCLNEKLPHVFYLDSLSFDEAMGFLQIRKCLIARRGYEIIQLAPKSIEKLMRIRSYEKSPFVPVPLLYLQLPIEDRPFLVDAMPPHQKHAAKEEVMEEYIEQNAERLANFCVRYLANKSDKAGTKIPKSLYWLISSFHVESQALDAARLKAIYLEHILDELVAKKGETFYRCVKELDGLEETNKRRNGQQNGDYTHDETSFPVLKPQPKAVTKGVSVPNLKGKHSVSPKPRSPPKKVDNFNIDQALEMLNRRK